MPPIRLAIVGVGKIVRDQHVPSLAGDADFELVATASPNSTLDGVAAFSTLEDLLASKIEVDAVSLCTPTAVRHGVARTALNAGKAVLLEKPPGSTVREVDDLAALADKRQVTLFATWHSRFAPGVEPARAWLQAKIGSGATVAKARVTWREDVRHWHPGQEWVFDPGALGVFDPGVNALSILTRILPTEVMVTQAELSFPSGRQSPIAATLTLADEVGAPIAMDLDWRQAGAQTWEIAVSTSDGGELLLSQGGAILSLDGQAQSLNAPGGDHAEYVGVYRRFAELCRGRTSEVDLRPLQLAADAFLVGRRREVEAFTF